MDLCSIAVAGFRRFDSRTLLKTSGKLVALLGPNEAGKSSLLHAIALLSHDGPPAPGDLTRGAARDSFAIEARYFLSQADREAAGLKSSKWFNVTKRVDGVRAFTISPSPPKRDFSARRRLSDCLVAIYENGKFRARVEEEDLFDDFNEIIDILQSDYEDISEENIARVLTFIQPISSKISDRDAATIRRLPKAFDEFYDAESEPNPGRFAIEALKTRLPDILVFDEHARDLASEYEMEALATSVPAALNNLCQIADLDVRALIAAHANEDAAGVATLEHRANERLKVRFQKDWQQSGISVSLRVHNEQLAVQVVNRHAEFTSFAERSDGLRQFVALQAFATGAGIRSAILLVDEADQKLHYDAQADLVQMLARQNLAAKVIYTTHSAGCLPEDLGNGVRFARPRREDETRSEVINKFWAENEPGFAPLLIGMGASTLAFFPTRHAVLVEGPSDILLLPTMFRDALELGVLGFQFVPGLSGTDDEGIIHASVIGKGSGILYLVDGDQGGEKLKTRLIKRGANKDDVFTLRNRDGSAQEVEDFLDLDLLLSATNRLLDKFRPGVTLEKGELSKVNRMAELEKTFQKKSRAKLPKVELAYEILDILSESPNQRVLAADRRAAFKTLASSMLSRFQGQARPTAVAAE